MSKVLRPAGIRWSEDTGFEILCPSCARIGKSNYYWPLTEEFWNWRKSLSLCRACLKDKAARAAKQKYRTSDKYREYRSAYIKKYREETKRARLIYQREYYKEVKADPVRYARLKEQQKAATARWRARNKAAQTKVEDAA